jgi:predicted alpha/beta superfamily hydrolase
MKYFFSFLFILFGTIHSIAQKTPFSIGVIDSLKSIELNETRRLNIYLPEGYSADSAQTYNVIYLLDGSADEDFIHVSGVVQFCNFSWINLLPPSIVVGISNVDRKRDFTFPTTIQKDKEDFPTTGESVKFISFVEKELQPYIDKNYKTNSNKMLIGQSLGGLLATEILYTKPHLFNQYLIVSPSLWWNAESLLKGNPEILNASYSSKTELFVAVGNEGKIMERDAKKLYKQLKKSKSTNLSVKFKFLGNKNHATIMHQAILNGFEAFNQLKTIE